MHLLFQKKVSYNTNKVTKFSLQCTFPLHINEAVVGGEAIRVDLNPSELYTNTGFGFM